MKAIGEVLTVEKETLQGVQSSFIKLFDATKFAVLDFPPTEHRGLFNLGSTITFTF